MSQLPTKELPLPSRLNQNAMGLQISFELLIENRVPLKIWLLREQFTTHYKIIVTPHSFILFTLQNNMKPTTTKARCLSLSLPTTTALASSLFLLPLPDFRCHFLKIENINVINKKKLELNFTIV